MEEFIPVQKLEEGFHKETLHLQNMIDSCKVLLDSKHYTTSIALSILIFEELAKFRDILSHLHKKKPITKEEWISISKGGSHNTKLTKLLQDATKDVIELGEDHHKRVQRLERKIGNSKSPDFQQIIKNNPNIKKLKNLNKIKQDCLYLNWNNSEWITFATKISQKEQSIMAEVLYYQNLFIFLEIVVESRHSSVSLDETSTKFQSYRNDPIRLKKEEIEKQVKSKEFWDKVRVAQSVMKDYS